MQRTKIEWSEMTWNPVTGCSPVSEGCQNCYARRIAYRLRGRFGYPRDEPFRVMVHPDRLNEPLKYKKRRIIFVCSMGDLFHEDVSDHDILAVWQKMGEYHDSNGQIIPIEKRPGHIYIVLTKRPERALEFLSRRYPLGFERKNVWLGVSAENQQRANERIPRLLQIPVAKRFVSIEPMLGPVDFSHLPESGAELNWVICGGESGPGARPMHPDWPRLVRDQCQAAGVPFFFKQWGEWLPKLFRFPEPAKYNQRWGTLDFMGNWFPKTTPWNGKQGVHSDSREYVMYNVGKKVAGRLLDSRIWEQYPEV